MVAASQRLVYPFTPTPTHVRTLALTHVPVTYTHTHARMHRVSDPGRAHQKGRVEEMLGYHLFLGNLSELDCGPDLTILNWTTSEASWDPFPHQTENLEELGPCPSCPVEVSRGGGEVGFLGGFL